MRYRDMGPGWIFLPALILAIVLILFAVSPAQGTTECPDPARPIHYLPFCLTQAEYVALTTPQPVYAPPAPLSVDVVERWRFIAEHFWAKHGQWVVDRMMRILRCESGGDPNARNPSSNTRGLWQVDDIWQVPWPGNYYDPWTNGAVAYQVWLEQGWGAWACRG